mgnify:CR=1 FL=1
MFRSGLLLIIVLLAGCGDGAPGTRGTALGGRQYGGVFNVNETEQLRSIFPLGLSQASAHRITAQIYQGLVKLDQRNLSVIPCLAERWEVDASATSYTFFLRQGVRFHDDPVFPDGKGREVTASDVVYCFTAICIDEERNHMFWLFQDRVEGANQHFAATSGGAMPSGGVTGLEVIDQYTVRIRLAHPVPNFLQIVAHQGCWIWPRELLEQYGNDLMTHAIGTGAFKLKEILPDQAMVLERNPTYWERDELGNQLPFLDAVRVTFVRDKAIELEQFLKGNITAMFEVPVERLDVLADSVSVEARVRFKVLSIAGLTTQFYGFNSTKPPFDNERVRKAFALAIDRRFLVDSVLKGMAVPAMHGLVAPGLGIYPYTEVGGFAFEPDSARSLLAAAGYPGGKGFPSLLLQVNSDGFGYVQVADAVQEMLERELRVRLSVSVLPADQHFDRIESGQAKFWREGWIADYPDPENFLALLYGKNAVVDTSQRTFLNTTRYHDPQFDALFALAQQSVDPAERAQRLAQAERKAIKDAVITPLYHDRNIRLQQPWVRDFPINSMEYRDLSAVWFDQAIRKDH